MKLLVFSIFFTISSYSYGQDQEFIDQLPVSFGSTQLNLTYLDEGIPSPFEGYLISVPDLALIKLAVDDSKTTCISLVEEIKVQCTKDITLCQKSATDRFKTLVVEKDSLILKNSILKNQLKDQKTSFIFYTALSVAATAVLTALVVNIGN